MIAQNYKYEIGEWVAQQNEIDFNETTAQLTLVFGAKHLIAGDGFYRSVRNRFPQSQIVLCSTAGEILDKSVTDNSIIATGLSFENTQVLAASVNIKDYEDSFEAGISLLGKLQKKGLVYVMILSDGIMVNGSDLIRASADLAARGVLTTGGMAGDGFEFNTTLCGLNANPVEGAIIAIGFYGENLKVTYGSAGGWKEFGAERRITRAEKNKVFEIDGENDPDILN